MAEIKSTIDLIMERTKNLTISEEEKQALKEKEFAAKARGLLVRYLDGSIDADSVNEEIGGEIDDISHGKSIVRKLMLENLDPEGDYERLLELMKKILGTDPSSVKSILAAFPETVSSLEAAKSVKIMEKLHKEGISGSAVTPNFAGDETWHTDLKKIKDRLKKDIEAALA